MASKHWSPACNSKNMSNDGINNNSKMGDTDEERGCEADLYENPTSREELEVRNFSRDYSRDYSYTESFRKSLPGIDLVNPRWVSTDSANGGGVLPSSYFSYESGRSTSMSKRIPSSGILVAHEGPEEELEDMMDKEKEKKESHLLLQCRALSTSQEHATIGACMGIVLTWKDLCVSIRGGGGGRGRPNMILNQLTGYAKPGQILAIMGPSGSGKTTLLDTLAGRLTSNMKQTGQILLNGKKQSLAYGNSAYVTQEDVLMATLTVQEAIFYSARLQLPENMSIQDKVARANAIIHDMGLQDDIDTRIGGWRAKGLSGGQKRRVTIATQILTHPKMLFLDEPTSGLDSAAAYHIVKRLKNLAMGGRTIIASIHQPSSDVFELFTSLYLLSNGRTIYFGPTLEASKFFSVNNFPCAPHRSPSDHYLRTINADFQRDVEEGDINEKLSTEEVIDILVEAYKKSNVAREVLKTVHEVPKMFQGTPTLETRSSHANFFTQVYILTIRSFKNMYRDLGYYWLRLGIYIALCLCVGTIFYDVGLTYNSIQARASMLMFVAAFLTFMAIGGFPSFVEDMKVFEAERLNGHYGVASFVVANTLSSIPFLLLISIVPGAMAYFLVNLHNGLDHFIFFILTLFTCLILVESLMMMVASLVPDFLLGIITGAGIQGVFMLNGGFFRLPNDLPKPLWRYPVSYMAFHFYANQGFYKNDFEGLTFESNVPGSPLISGDSILRDTYQVTMSYSKWVNLGILVGMAIIYRLIFFFLIKLKERLRPVMRNFMSRHTMHHVVSHDIVAQNHK